jgi:hypothetical protein
LGHLLAPLVWSLNRRFLIYQLSGGIVKTSFLKGWETFLTWLKLPSAPGYFQSLYRPGVTKNRRNPEDIRTGGNKKTEPLMAAPF